MGLHIRAAVKGSENLRRMLNEAIARELAGSTQFIWYCFQTLASGRGVAADPFREISSREVKHAEAIAERLCRIGGLPIVVPRPALEGKSANECLDLAARSKEETIRFYRRIIEQAENEGDAATAFLLKEILEDEEEHRDLLVMMMEDRPRSTEPGIRPHVSDMRFRSGSEPRSQKENAAAPSL